jgi:hypothetical protein
MIAVPDLREAELWTPPGVTHTSVTPVGRNAETGKPVYKYSFQVYDEETGRRHEFQVLVDDTTTKAHIEEMVGNAMESWLVDVRIRHAKPPPTKEQRKEIGKVLDQIRIHSLKRKESSNGKIYYPGLKGAKYGGHGNSGNGRRSGRGPAAKG